MTSGRPLPGSRAGGAPIDAAAAWVRLLDVRGPAEARAAGLRPRPDGRWEWTSDASTEATQLAYMYVPLCLGGPTLAYAQLGQSLDGFIATRTGDACFVTGEEDRRHLHRLRALADAVVVGAATVIADDPQLTVRSVPGRSPVRVVLDPHGRVSPDRRLLTDAMAPTLWVLGRDAPERQVAAPAETLRLPTDDGRFTARQVLEVLALRGLGRVLVEGGGRTVSRMLAERALQRLYLTVAPVLIGDGVRGIQFAGSPGMSDALRPPTRRFLLGADVLFELDLAAGAVPAR